MFAGILIGLILGLGIALGVAWYINKMPSPFVDRQADSKTPVETPQAAQATDEKKVEKPRFDFYKILPGQDVPVTNDKTPQSSPSAAPISAASTEPASESYYLQAGAFQKKDDADNMKAKLAMLGLESDIHAGPGNESKYRVRIGPYPNQDDLKKTQDTLQQNGITANIVKIKETSQ